jgi:hypothetical protein
MARGAKKGCTKPAGSGRGKGVTNKNTTDLKEMVFGALNAGEGGTAFLTQQKTDNPVAFMNLLSKFVPRDLKVDGDMKITIVASALDEYV